MLVAMAAIAVAITGTGGEGHAGGAGDRVEQAEPPPQPRVPEPPRPEPERDEKGYPEGTRKRFTSTCRERTPLDEDTCACVYRRLHERYDYDEFAELIGKIDPEDRKVPGEILEQVARCRLPDLPAG